MTLKTPLDRYRADLQRPEFIYDPAQEMAVGELQALYEALLVKPAPRAWDRLVAKIGRKTVEPVRGLYFWGGVGRGKTYLVDTFFEALPFEEKRRLHFHRFMREVHAQLKQLKDQQNPLRVVAQRFAEQARVLCFDEFFVSDIADAMILGGLFEALFERGVTLVATSNIEPDGLYRDGLQRERFLPAISLIKQHTKVVNVDGGTDYRLRFLERAEIFHSPHDAKAEALLEEDFLQIAGAKGEAAVALDIEGRPIRSRRVSDGVAWFDFSELCDGPRSQSDYIELARLFHTVLLSDIPAFTYERDDQARRFISLIDEFYDRNVKLLMTAAVPPAELYQGRRLAFAFERTVSRIEEMQSKEYLARAHRP
ncbi:cell division protein ZapE [Alkalilimnicola ehrlichii]|uniref:Cell division protein ZapE n=1 Tax=Alkalilimnicola ehrlichii TaxID=351052 RepID=A0A3E0X4B9_9GAMM|nr:cell division protein ZapE [Alkalilimnicola ehrlichii]RFA31192.1 cell division protein ZapE [Alkalilimnicola ehrlichii]RFA39525.1 cell division protein ZapE [Alkalilimnicola ehrlichii]